VITGRTRDCVPPPHDWLHSSKQSFKREESHSWLCSEERRGRTVRNRSSNGKWYEMEQQSKYLLE